LVAFLRFCCTMTGALPRELLRGSLDLMVLSALADEPKYGYLIQRRIAQASSGADGVAQVKLQAGTLYPLLHRLEADKLIRSRWDDATGRRRKWYELTAAGRRRLRHDAQQWRRYVECLQRLLAPALGPPPEPA
jgi:DNA-binding PadR family transcriptional regulator